MHTLVLVYTEYDYNLVPSDTNELLDRAYTPPREFRKQDHPFNIVVL